MYIRRIINASHISLLPWQLEYICTNCLGTEKLCCCKSHKAVNNAVVSESSQDQAASKPSSNAYTYVDLNKSAVVYEEVELEGRVSENSTSTIRNPIYSRTSEFANEDINNPLYHIVEPEENQYESPADTLEGEAAGQAVIYEYVPSNVGVHRPVVAVMQISDAHV